MKQQILRCCKKPPFFLVVYVIGSQYLVCNSCINLEHWCRGIKKQRMLQK